MCIPPPAVSPASPPPGTPVTDLDATVNFRTANPSASPRPSRRSTPAASAPAARRPSPSTTTATAARASGSPRTRPGACGCSGTRPCRPGSSSPGTPRRSSLRPRPAGDVAHRGPDGQRTVKGSSQFLPTPTDLPCPGGVNASYPGGAAARPGSTTLVVSYVDLCLGSGGPSSTSDPAWSSTTRLQTASAPTAAGRSRPRR